MDHVEVRARVPDQRHFRHHSIERSEIRNKNGRRRWTADVGGRIRCISVAGIHRYWHRVFGQNGKAEAVESVRSDIINYAAHVVSSNKTRQFSAKYISMESDALLHHSDFESSIVRTTGFLQHLQSTSIPHLRFISRATGTRHKRRSKCACVMNSSINLLRRKLFCLHRLITAEDYCF